ncbi:RagB/SusD family nutrient uptake outer membrane protein [Halalkalibaculum sp. DA3122]|uniref:RagB/SusD family nutrient uptake outer membrane protein n=1 Tax=Halalkalibaculum sp. DA3122 TaxID=3373607 RepID=UPI0037549084
MKSLISKVFVLSVILFMSAGCGDDFLDLENPNEITAGTFFETPEQMQQAVNTLYSSAEAVRGFGDQQTFGQNARGIDMQLTDGAFAAQVDYANFTTTPESGASDSYWEGLYTMIFRANTILGNIDRVDWTGNESMRDLLTAETHFFRGLGYFYLAHLYGQVPIVTKQAETDDEFNPPKAESIGAVYDQAISDLQTAKQGLPETRATDGQVTSGTATGFLGKTYLYRASYLDEPSNYSLAATEFKEVIDSGVYGLVDNYVDNFTAVNENNEESLFEIQYKFNTSPETPTQSRPFNSVPGIGFEIFLRPSDWVMQEMAEEQTVDGNFDPRYLETIYFHGGLPLFSVPYNELGSGIRCEGGQGVGGAPDGSSTTEGGWWRKYLNVNLGCPPQLTGGSAENNERVLRYADILLMYAEAVTMDAGSVTQEAVDAVQQVRDRANLATKTTGDYASADELMDEIKHQRVMEFTYENMYYFDLIRWGELGDALQQYGTPTQAANYDPVKHKYFPIPTSEVVNNSNLEQNDPWK